MANMRMSVLFMVEVFLIPQDIDFGCFAVQFFYGKLFPVLESSKAAAVGFMCLTTMSRFKGVGANLSEVELLQVQAMQNAGQEK